MSGIEFVKLPIKVIEDKTLSDKEKVVFAILLTFADFKDFSNCFPSISTIAQKSGCHPSTIKRSLKNLKKNNYINWIKGKKGKSNLYSFSCRGSPANQPRSRNEPSVVAETSHHQEPTNKRQEQYKLNKLFYGNDPCSIKENGDILIISEKGLIEWSGYHIEDFRFGNLQGDEARKAAYKTKGIKL